MQNLTVLKLLHDLAALLLLGGAAALAYRGVCAAGPAALGQTLQRPWAFVWLAMGLSLLVLPISGWWLVHDGGWSLGQTWLLSASLLYTFGLLCWLWLLARLKRMGMAGPVVSVGQRRAVVALAAAGAAIWLATLCVMVLKPV